MERSEVPDRFRTIGPSDNQRAFILSLRDQKRLTDDQKKWIDDNIDRLTPGRDGTASKCIKRLLKLPNAKISAQDVMVAEVPAGRYAIENEEGELRFYHVWRPKNEPSIFQVYVLHGPDSSRVPGRNAEIGIMTKIAKAGVRECAIRYGNEIGACSNCGRRLTNRISRELGIGPICGGRMFDDGDWKEEVKAARERIVARGEEPDEEVVVDGPAIGDPNACDKCGQVAQLFHNEATGLALCDTCDMAAE